MQVSELLTYLLPSWAYTACQPEAATNIVDLIVFCEEPFCAALPATCRPLVNTSGLLFLTHIYFRSHARRWTLGLMRSWQQWVCNDGHIHSFS